MSQRRRNNPLGLYLFFFILFIYLFFKFGLRFFVDMAFNLTQKGSTVNSQAIKNNSKISLISEPVLDDMPDATNEAVLKIQGKAAPDTEIILYNNKKKEDSTRADFEGSFQFEYVLEEKNNQFTILSKNTDDNKSSESKIYNVTFIDNPPKLEIKTPEDGKKYYESRLTVEGITDKEVFVKVNNMPVVIKADGSFTYPVSLNKGNNEINIVAQDIAGNETEKKLNVTYVE